MSEREYRTKSGRVLTDADIQALADEAERGYEVSEFVGRTPPQLAAFRALGRTPPLAAFRARLMDLGDEAMRELPWLDLASYIDALNEEYQHFTWLISQRKIGAHVPKIARPKGRTTRE